MPEEENEPRIEDDPKEAGYAISGEDDSDVAPDVAAEVARAEAIEDDPKEAGYAITSE